MNPVGKVLDWFSKSIYPQVTEMDSDTEVYEDALSSSPSQTRNNNYVTDNNCDNAQIVLETSGMNNEVIQENNVSSQVDLLLNELLDKTKSFKKETDNISLHNKNIPVGLLIDINDETHVSDSEDVINEENNESIQCRDSENNICYHEEVSDEETDSSSSSSSSSFGLFPSFNQNKTVFNNNARENDGQPMSRWDHFIKKYNHDELNRECVEDNKTDFGLRNEVSNKAHHLKTNDEQSRPISVANSTELLSDMISMKPPLQECINNNDTVINGSDIRKNNPQVNHSCSKPPILQYLETKSGNNKFREESSFQVINRTAKGRGSGLMKGHKITTVGKHEDVNKEQDKIELKTPMTVGRHGDKEDDKVELKTQMTVGKHGDKEDDKVEQKTLMTVGRHGDKEDDKVELKTLMTVGRHGDKEDDKVELKTLMTVGRHGDKEDDKVELKTLMTVGRHGDIKKQENIITLLLLGPSGVGKSTFINGVVNYVKYSSFNDAMSGNYTPVIPTKFTILDNCGNMRLLTTGNDSNETLDLGVSCTKQCKTYQFKYEEKVYNIIDTPGISDTGSIDQDLTNTKIVLDYLSKISKINLICLLLKPNESRSGPVFQFFIKEILARLDKSAINNITICFTNSVSTMFKPGETLPILSCLIETLNLNLKLDHRNMFCFDNEVHKYMCTRKLKDVSYTKDQVNIFKISWTKSCFETKRLLDCASVVEPHDVHNTMSLNNARLLVINLLKPVTDVIQNIAVNSTLINEQIKTRKNDYGNSENQNNQFHLVYKDKITHSSPLIVCTNCLINVKLTNTGYTFQKLKICFENVHIKPFVPNVCYNEILKTARNLFPAGRCKNCNCKSDLHMHTLEEVNFTEEVQKTAVTSVTDCETVMNQLLDKDLELKNLKTELLYTSSLFTLFLNKNSITKYVDKIKIYLLNMIQEHVHMEEQFYDMILSELKEGVVEYENNLLDLKKKKIEVTVSDIYRLENQLYNLPVYGACLQDLMKNKIEYSQENFEYLCL